MFFSTEQNQENSNLSRLLAKCSHLPTTEAYKKIISFFTTHYDPRKAQNLPAIFSAATQVISILGGRSIQDMATQNSVMLLFASISTAIIKGQTPVETAIPPSNVNEAGNHASWNSTQGLQLLTAAIRESERGCENGDDFVRPSSRSNASVASHNLRVSSSSTVKSNLSPIRSTDTEGWKIFDSRASSAAEPAVHHGEEDNHTPFSAPISFASVIEKKTYVNNLRTIGTDIAQERFFDLILFAIACGYKSAGGPSPLSAESTNALVWDLLSASQQGMAQALSYIMYRNYAWGITVLCSMATKVIELMNKTPDANMKAILYSAMLGMVVGISMIAINYMEHQSVLAVGNAERPNTAATDAQREKQKDEFEDHLNNWEKMGFYPNEITACQDPNAEDEDMYSGHVSALVVEALSIYQLTRAISERYPNNVYINYLSHTLFAIGCAFAGETAATRVLGDCHTLESVMIASTKFNSPAIMAKFLGDLLDLAITNPQMFVTAARATWDGVSKGNTISLTNNMALNNERRVVENPLHQNNFQELKGPP